MPRQNKQINFVLGKIIYILYNMVSSNTELHMHYFQFLTFPHVVKFFNLLYTSV